MQTTFTGLLELGFSEKNDNAGKIIITSAQLLKGPFLKRPCGFAQEYSLAASPPLSPP